MFCSLRSLNKRDVLAVLANFTTVRRRMILVRRRMISRVKETVPSLRSLARDSILIGLIDTNQERLVSDVVAKLGETDITIDCRDLLLAKVISYLLWIQEIFYCNYFRTRICNFVSWRIFISQQTSSNLHGTLHQGK